MSSNGYALPLRLDIKASRQLKLCLILFHLLMILEITVLAASIAAKTGLLVMVLASLCFYLYRYRNGGTTLPTTVLLKDAGNVLVEFSAADSRRARVAGDSYLHPYLLILNLRFVGGGSLSLPLLRDSLASDQHRRLRVYLRLQQYRLATQKPHD